MLDKDRVSRVELRDSFHGMNVIRGRTERKRKPTCFFFVISTYIGSNVARRFVENHRKMGDSIQDRRQSHVRQEEIIGT